MTAINGYSIMEAAALMAAGKLTAVALAEHCLARVAAREKDVQAWAYIDRDNVMAQAIACDRESRRSPLHGIPVGVKDIIDTADMPTAYGSPIYAGYRPRSDAACVAILKNAGAIIMGKTVTAEFAMRQPGKTRNPHNAAHTPGGSSSGSAAAVADFMVPLALGTQTGGSIIRPAAFCGTFGFKPTFNIINRAGVKPAAESLDTVGFFARSLPDVTIALSVMTGSEIADLSPFERNKPRLAFCRTPQWQHADHSTVQALEDAVTALAQAGAHIRELQLPPQFDAMLEAQGATSDYESVRALAAQLGILAGYREGTPGVLVIPHVIAEVMAQLGWTKQLKRQFLWEHSSVSQEQLRSSAASEWIQMLAPERAELDPWPIAARAENMVVIVAGGGHPTNVYWLPACCPKVIGREIYVPERFKELISEAEQALSACS